MNRVEAKPTYRLKRHNVTGRRVCSGSYAEVQILSAVVVTRADRQRSNAAFVGMDVCCPLCGRTIHTFADDLS